MSPLPDIDELHAQFIADLLQATIWHGYARTDGIPALQYSTYGNQIVKLYEVPPHRADNGLFDYAAVYARFDLCNKIRSGVVDEVWIWESGDGNAWEWVTNGDQWSWTWGSNVPNCGRVISTLNLNYQRTVDMALHSYGHRVEGAMMTHVPCSFYTKTWPWVGWPDYCASRVSDIYGYVGRAFAGNNYVAVCGDIHHPPNITDDREYVYDDPSSVSSICEDWQWTGDAQVSNFTCAEWGCDGRGFVIWWLQNIPGIGNNNRNHNGSVMSSWWTFLFDIPAPPPSTGTGLRGQYYPNTELAGEPITRVDPAVQFYWGLGGPAALGRKADDFSVRWTGKIRPAFNETYVFYVYSDDGVRLWVDNQLLIDQWVIQGSTETSALIDLRANQLYDIVLEYFEARGVAEVSLSWASPSQSKSYIPQNRLYPPFDAIVPIGSAPFRNYFTTEFPQLSWGHLSWATCYDTQIAYDTFFSRLVLNRLCVSGLSLTPDEPLGDGLYHWRVRGRRTDNTSGIWSAADTFIIDTTP